MIGRVEQAEGPHADQALGAVCAPLEVRAQQHFGVAVRTEHVAAGAEIVADLDVVVDLAVFGQREAAAFIVHRHVAERAQVEDAQPLVSERAAAEDFEALIVRATMALRVGHRLERRDVLRRDLRPIEAVDPRDAAHSAPYWCVRDFLTDVCRPLSS